MCNCHKANNDSVKLKHDYNTGAFCTDSKAKVIKKKKPANL